MTALLRRPGPPRRVDGFRPQADDPAFAAVVPAGAALLELHAGAIHLEGPAWQPARGRLVFSDVPNRRVAAWYADDGRIEVLIDAAPFPNGAALLPDGGLVHCAHGPRGLVRSPADPEGWPAPWVTRFEGRRLNSPNDVAVAPDGAVWFTDPVFGIVMPAQGTLAEPELDHRSVYRIDPATAEPRRMADFEQPNGLAFSPGGSTLYVSDTSLSLGEAPGHAAGAKHEVVAFDVAADGTLSGRRFFAHADHGVPDGLKVDGRGWVWVTGADGVHAWSPDRRRLGFLPIPETVSNLAFGGPDGRRLFLCATTRLFAIDLAA